VALIQGNFGSETKGNLEAVLRVERRVQGIGQGDHLVHVWFEYAESKWHWETIMVGNAWIGGVTGDPAFIQSTFGTKGNFHLMVPRGNNLAHYRRENDASNLPWRKLPDAFRAQPQSTPTALTPDLPTSVAMIQTKGITKQMEAMVGMTSQTADEGLANYVFSLRFDPSGDKWHPPQILLADGHVVADVTGF
jgi:hypothetical protein